MDNPSETPPSRTSSDVLGEVIAMQGELGSLVRNICLILEAKHPTIPDPPSHTSLGLIALGLVKSYQAGVPVEVMAERLTRLLGLIYSGYPFEKLLIPEAVSKEENRETVTASLPTSDRG